MIYAKCAHLLIRTFVSLIQYQYDGNVQLIAGLLRKRTSFEALTKLTYSDYIMEHIQSFDINEKRNDTLVQLFDIPQDPKITQWSEAEVYLFLRAFKFSLLMLFSY